MYWIRIIHGVMSKKATISWLDEPLVNTRRQNTAWTGSISIKESLTPAKLKEIRRQIADFYVPTKLSSSIRCIDGRPSKSPTAVPGPQVAGGLPCSALAHHSIKQTKNIISAILNLTSDNRTGFLAGAHIDDHATGPMCGCGAIDKMPDIIKRISEHSGAIQNFAQTILGDDYIQHVFDKTTGFYSSINTGDFLPRDYRQKTIALVEQVRGTVEQVTGPHKEIAIVINFQPHTTFNKDGFAENTKNEFQAFNYDYWLSKYMASKIHRNRERQREFLTAHAIYNIAAAMVLTDGSLAMGIRQ